jgi:16S rRNA processing protein RimM
MDGIVIARTLRPWGNKGEVSAEILTDFPERFADVKKVRLRRGGTDREATLKGHRFHKGRVLLKFEGANTISDAETLVNFDVVISDEELYQHGEGEDFFYDFQLIGCCVVDREGAMLGTVARVIHTGAGPLLEISRPRESTALIPFIDEMCPDVDVEAKRITVELPEGLLDL